MDNASEDKLVDNIRNVAWMLERRGHKISAKTVIEAADHIERLSAEIERLTPKPMTADEVCRTLNEIEYRDETCWDHDYSGSFWSRGYGCDSVYIDEFTAYAVAEKSKREENEDRLLTQKGN